MPRKNFKKKKMPRKRNNRTNLSVLNNYNMLKCYRYNKKRMTNNKF